MPRHPALQTTRHPRLHHRFAAGKCSGRRGNFTCSVSACLQLRQTLEFFNSPDPASASLKRGDKRPGTVGLVVETWNEVDVNDDRRSNQCPANRSRFSGQVPHFGFIFHLWRCCGSRGSFSRADCKQDVWGFSLDCSWGPVFAFVATLLDFHWLESSSNDSPKEDCDAIRMSLICVR